jgi:ribose transport system substrate-binding protein
MEASVKRQWIVWPALAALALAGCGKEESAGPPPPKTPEKTGGAAAPAAALAPITGPELDAVKKPDKPFKLALIVKTRNNPFFTPMIKAAEAEAKSLGVSLETLSPAQETDKERQFSIVQDVTAKGVDAILIAPADSKGIVPALKAAADKGILIVNIDNRVDAPTAKAAGLNLGGYVGADNEAGGKLAGEEMVVVLKSAGKAAMLEGIRGTDNAEARKRGFVSAVKGRLDMVASDSAEWDTAKAYAKFQSMLAAHRDINGLFCANDKMALGAMKAIKEAGQQSRITVIGYDNIPDVKPYLKNGEMEATIEQHPDLMGRYGVEMAVGILSGSVPKGREYLVPLEVIKK